MAVSKNYFNENGIAEHEAGVRDIQGRVDTVIGAARNSFDDAALAHGHIYNDGTHITYYTKDGEPSELPVKYDSAKVNVIRVISNNECASPITIPISPEDLGDVKTEFATNKLSFIYYDRMLDTLIDGGNTENVLHNIYTAYPGGAWELRNELLGLSPFLSAGVLATAIANQNVFSHADLFEFLVANPDGFWSNYAAAETFLDTTDMPGWMVDYLWDMYESGNTVTYRTILEGHRARHSEQMFDAWRAIVTTMLIDSAGYHPDTMLNWLANVEHYEAEIEASWMVYNMDRHDTSIVEYMEEFSDYLFERFDSDSSHIRHDVLWNMALVEYFQGESNNFADSTYNFASPEDGMHTYGSDLGCNTGIRRTKNLLDYFLYSDSAKYDDQPVFPSISYGKKEESTYRKRRNNTAPLSLLKAYPVPAYDILNIEYTLADGLAYSDITIADINGKIVHKERLTQKQYQQRLDVKNWINGIYSYKVDYNGIAIATGKLSIIH